MIYGLPEKLKEERIKNRLSQKQVAERLGVSPAIVSMYETGERTPSLEILQKLSALYHISADYLLDIHIKTSDTNLDVSGLDYAEVTALDTIVNSMKRRLRFIAEHF